MRNGFEQALDDWDAAGLFAYAAFLWHEFAGVFAAASAMRTAEYIFRARRFAISLASGAAVAAFAQSLLFSNCGIGRHWSIDARIAEPPQTPDAFALPFLLTGVCLILICILAATFVWNVRNIRKRRV
jgi:hypothetical protein